MVSEWNINSFVATMEEALKFLESYRDDLFYFDINPTEPPTGARQFEITTFAPNTAQRIIDEIHPGIEPPRMTPGARAKIGSAPPPPLQDEKTPFEIGMNIHPTDGVGWNPLPAELGKVAWVRFPFTSSPRRFPNVDAAFNFYDKVIDAYNQLGVKIILVMNHETYGEGEGYNWTQMNSTLWAKFTSEFLIALESVLRQYGDKISAYEIWNEGDAEPQNPAAVTFPPRDFAPLLDRAENIIRQYAPEAAVVLGGLVRGPEIGVQYVKQVQAALNGRLPVDAIGYHPYGKGAPGDITVFSRLGSIAHDIDVFQKAFPNIPLWLTEVGALGTDDPNYWDDAALYMKNLFTYLRTQQSKRAPVAIWYAWSDGMDMAQKTNGMVKVNGERKPYLYDTFFRETAQKK